MSSRMICDCPKVQREPCARALESAVEYCSACGHGLACHVERMLVVITERVRTAQRTSVNPLLNFVRRAPRPQPLEKTYEQPSAAFAAANP